MLGECPPLTSSNPCSSAARAGTSLSKETVIAACVAILFAQDRARLIIISSRTHGLSGDSSNAACKYAMHVCAATAASKTCTSHAHSSFVSSHPKPPPFSLSLLPSVLSSFSSPAGHFSYHASPCIIRGCIVHTWHHVTRSTYDPSSANYRQPRRQGIASKFATPSSSNELANARFFLGRATRVLPRSRARFGDEINFQAVCRFVWRTNDLTQSLRRLWPQINRGT